MEKKEKPKPGQIVFAVEAQCWLCGKIITDVRQTRRYMGHMICRNGCKKEDLDASPIAI